MEPRFGQFSDEIREQMARDALYAQYLQRQVAEVDALQRDADLKIPPRLDIAAIAGLSNELVSKLVRLRPASIAEAGRIEGMTPSALALLCAHSFRFVSSGLAGE